MRDITELRRLIDGIDSEMLPLFLKRLDIAKEVAEYKAEKNLPILDAKRERELINNKLDKLVDKQYEDEVREFFVSVMSISRSVQGKKMISSDIGKGVLDEAVTKIKAPYEGEYCVVFQGDKGAYSEEALTEFFGMNQKRFNVLTFDKVFEVIESGEAAYGVLPIENSSTGAISDVLDLLKRHKFYIVGEHQMRIKHCLLGVKGAKIEDIDEIYSHEQGFRQCSEFLKKYPDINLKPYYNTAVSAKLVSEIKDMHKAAIASAGNAEIYGLDIICENINHNSFNTTRFIIISKYPEITDKSNKISIAIKLKHESGMLYNVISYFARSGLNLLKIESRPIVGKNFEYIFFVDFSGNILNNEVKKATEAVSANCSEFQFLGNYSENIQV